MKRTGRKQEWSIALFASGVLVFFPPLLSIFDSEEFVLGLPISYLYLFGMWAVIIAAIAIGAKPRRRRAGEGPPRPGAPGPLPPRMDGDDR